MVPCCATGSEFLSYDNEFASICSLWKFQQELKTFFFTTKFWWCLPSFNNSSLACLLEESSSRIIRPLLPLQFSRASAPPRLSFLLPSALVPSVCLQVVSLSGRSVSLHVNVTWFRLTAFCPSRFFLASVSLSWFPLSDTFFSLVLVYLLPVCFTWPWDQRWVFLTSCYLDSFCVLQL